MFGDVLIVDDEQDIRNLIAGILEDEGYTPRQAGDSDSALREVNRRCPSLVLLDVWLQGSRLDGLEILNLLSERYPHLPVVIISGHGNIDTAVSAIRSGAYDYIEKPYKADKLLLTVQRAIEAAKLQRENTELRRKAGVNFALIGQAGVIEQLNGKIDKLAQANSRVMIVGPPGSGKQAAARQIHSKSPRASQNFVSVHGAIIGSDTARARRVLFGSETGENIEAGLLEQAHGGTVFLDEIASFPMSVQGEILKTLHDGGFQRVGGEQLVQIDVRVLSSCSEDPEALVASGDLMQDLYHRLNVVILKVPGLSKRRDDIPYLVEYFISTIADQLNMAPRKVGHDVMAVLQSHSWPGNVRQLRNCIEHMMLTCLARNSEELSLSHLPTEIVTDTDVNENIVESQHIMSLPLRDAREIFEREYLIAQINRFSGNVSRTAEFVGMERSALHRKMKSLGIGTSNHAKSQVS
jgi:two-component system nitrogen regulation response regulator NtrX